MLLAASRGLTYGLEFVTSLPRHLHRLLLLTLTFSRDLGALRYLLAPALAYLLFALLLVYVFAPLRGLTGGLWALDKLKYDSERWLATAIYDRSGNFVGTFDPALDSRRDVNFTDRPIAIGDTGYVANPDHKSIPVRSVPEAYWRCLVYHEDRNLGSWLNPYGIDLVGVLKIPLSSLYRTLQTGRPQIGVGGSTLPMQLARVIYKTPPRSDESALDKLRRKFGEWWDAPVIYRALTRGGDDEPLKHWAADHLWLAQRTGGSPLHGVEMASRIVFGKPAAELSVAEQFVLASAVNKPIILLEGNDRLNAVRLDRWRYIVDVRARKCAGALLADETEQKTAWFELTRIANGPPDPQAEPALQRALEEIAPTQARAALANPVLRANLLVSTGRYGIREELKQDYGYGWREHVRGVTLTFDAIDNRRFAARVRARLTQLQQTYAAQIDQGYTLDPGAVGAGVEMPNVVIAAADAHGAIVRYYEASDTADYFGSLTARSGDNGVYLPEREPRAIASIGKMLAAIAIANEGKDNPDTPYLDSEAPASGIETCRHDGSVPRGRRARVAFACSLNKPVEWRAAQLGQASLLKLIADAGFTMPPRDPNGEATPASTAMVRGLVTASPRKVHQLAGVVLAALTGQAKRPVPLPTLIAARDKSLLAADAGGTGAATSDLVPADIIRAGGAPLLRTLLSAPLCYAVGKQQIGTLKSISDWCADRRPGVALHFAKTGTQVTLDPDATVDTWAAGGIQFANGAAYSYVVVVGTGSVAKPWGRRLHAAQIAAPLVESLLLDLEALARNTPALAASKAATPPSP